MIGVTVNIRGVSKLGRMQSIADLISDHKVDFITFQETKKEKLSERFLNFIAGNFAFKWFTLPAIKTVGGILLGVKEEVFDVISVSYGPSHISVILRNKSDAFV